MCIPLLPRHHGTCSDLTLISAKLSLHPWRCHKSCVSKANDRQAEDMECQSRPGFQNCAEVVGIPQVVLVASGETQNAETKGFQVPKVVCLPQKLSHNPRGEVKLAHLQLLDEFFSCFLARATIPWYSANTMTFLWIWQRSSRSFSSVLSSRQTQKCLGLGQMQTSQ